MKPESCSRVVVGAIASRRGPIPSVGGRGLFGPASRGRSWRNSSRAAYASPNWNDDAWRRSEWRRLRAPMFKIGTEASVSRASTVINAWRLPWSRSVSRGNWLLPGPNGTSWHASLRLDRYATNCTRPRCTKGRFCNNRLQLSSAISSQPLTGRISLVSNRTKGSLPQDPASFQLLLSRQRRSSDNRNPEQ